MQRVNMFINVLHNINTTDVNYNVTDSKGKIVGVASKKEILNANFYFGNKNSSFLVVR